ncbi:ThiS family protein [Thalassoglobus neptunius]|uniref:ThiS family protein n=1 Tax=Thalassoglobus neptunius TaxID=1938619 RepID=A0A5C5WMY8_9PLAN|nr:MoaD/ThiS family protein [Thalassoglobus neptunius]TWT51987.1 ThiS family protein [Thalassoglobus neptunius]
MVKVEFFGIPRQRTGVSHTTLEATTIGNLLNLLAQQYPDFRDTCMEEEQLTKDVLVSVNGKTTTRDRACPLQENDNVLILTADVGG